MPSSSSAVARFCNRHRPRTYAARFLTRQRGRRQTLQSSGQLRARRESIQPGHQADPDTVVDAHTKNASPDPRQ